MTEEKEKWLTETLEEYLKNATGYLDGFIDDTDEYTDIEDFIDVVVGVDDLFCSRIYDLAIYDITNRLLNELKRK